MKITHLLAASSPAALLAPGLMLLATAAAAQTAPAPTSGDPTDTHQVTTPNDPTTDQIGTRPGEQAYPDQDNAAKPNSEVVVTGSRLARPGLTSIAPVESITADELLSNSHVNLGDALNELPQLRGTYSQANSTRFIGTTGLNELDLRGLGTARTLVLVNGRRHVTSVPGTSIVDTNTIPDDLLERVDVVTGGDSAIYGSDAVAGVVNFVLKQDYNGFRLQGQGGATTYGDHGSQYVSGVYGKNFAEGRGNVAVAAEYSHTDPLYFRDRDFFTGAYSGRTQFNLNTYTGANGPDPLGNIGVPQQAYYSGVRNGSISDGGIFNAVCTPAATAAGNAALCRTNSNYLTYNPTASQASRTAYLGQRYAFDNNGNLVLSNPTLDFRDITAGGSTNTIGGLGSTLRNTGELAPQQDRVSVNALAHYDFSPAFTLYGEGKYVHIFNNQEGQPSFFQNGVISTAQGTRTLILCNNGFISAATRATLVATGYCSNGSTATQSVPLSRFNTDFGGRGELSDRNLYRFVAGARGTFLDTWKYDFSVDYGEYRSHLRSLNNLLTTNFANAANAVVAPATFTGANYALNAAGQRVICSIDATTNVDPACVPINLFGVGSPSQQALNYVNTTTNRYEFSNQIDINGYVAGDLGKLFTLPGGPVAFVLGGEYRRENSHSNYDLIVQQGLTFLNAILPFTPPTLRVKEGFGELSVPLLKDKPFFRELTLDGAARVSSYNNSAGTTWSYNAGAVWAPVSMLKLRGNYSKSIRVPTQSDLYSPFSQNFAFINDPCDTLYINQGTSARPGNCAAAGIPAGFANTPARSVTQSYLSGGNPNLKPETSKSFTVGAVIQPTNYVPGLSITVDFYKITVNNLISTLSAQTVVNSCYDNITGLNNPYCPLITRNADGTFANNGILSAGVNFAKQKTDGIDTDIAYNHTMSNGDRLATSIIVSWVGQRDNYVNPAIPTYATRLLYELGDPQWRVRATFGYTKGIVDFRYTFNFLGRQTIAATSGFIGGYSVQNAFDGRAPTDADQFPTIYYPDVTYHDIRVNFNVNKKFQFYLGADNITNQLPPLGLLGNEGGSEYDPYGRTLYGGVKVNF